MCDCVARALGSYGLRDAESVDESADLDDQITTQQKGLCVVFRETQISKDVVAANHAVKCFRHGSLQMWSDECGGLWLVLEGQLVGYLPQLSLNPTSQVEHRQDFGR